MTFRFRMTVCFVTSFTIGELYSFFSEMSTDILLTTENEIKKIGDTLDFKTYNIKCKGDGYYGT